jgi:hypothetical protein
VPLRSGWLYLFVMRPYFLPAFLMFLDCSIVESLFCFLFSSLAVFCLGTSVLNLFSLSVLLTRVQVFQTGKIKMKDVKRKTEGGPATTWG